MEKEIQILVGMCLAKKQTFNPNDFAIYLNLKYTEGVYPYIRMLVDKKLIKRLDRGEYTLNKENQKVQDMLFITEIVGNKSEILFTKHARIILEKFSTKPMINKSKLPEKSLRLIKDIAYNTKIIYPTGDSYFIASWEEPTRKLLNFFDIKIKFDEEEFKHEVVKHFAAIPNTKTPVDSAQQLQLKRQNLEQYMSNRDYILDKLKEVDFDFLSIIGIITTNKGKEFRDNPFAITSKIADWKMKYIYNTDRIEGNPLTMQEVRTILTTGGLNVEKNKKAVLETINSRTALDNIFNTTNELTIEFIKNMHLATQFGLDQDAGKYKTSENCITDDSGNLMDTTTPVEFVEKRMNALLDWYNEYKRKLHPFALATIVHNQFVYIHPFNDGNGRVARLLFNFILIKNGFFPIIFYNDEKEKYYACIRSGKDGSIKQFLVFCNELYRTQLDEF